MDAISLSSQTLRLPSSRRVQIPLSLGQRFAIAAVETCDCIISQGNQVPIRWVLSDNGAEGNETADTYEKAAASRSAPCHEDAIPRELLNQATHYFLSHAATEARSCVPAEWIWENVRAEPGPLRGEACATSLSVAPESGAFTSAWPATPTLVRTLTGRGRSTRYVLVV